MTSGFEMTITLLTSWLTLFDSNQLSCTDNCFALPLSQRKPAPNVALRSQNGMGREGHSHTPGVLGG